MIGERIRQRRKELGMSQDDLALLMQYDSRATISKIESGIIDMNVSKVPEFASALSTTTSYLMGWEKAKKTESIAVPLIGQVAAGTPILAEENIEEYFHIDSSIKADFCLKVKGDSMIDADIHSEDIAFFRKQPTLDNGEIGAVVLDGEATLKRFYKYDGSIVLQPENKDYRPIIISDGDIYIAGKLVAVLSLNK